MGTRAGSPQPVKHRAFSQCAKLESSPPTGASGRGPPSPPPPPLEANALPLHVRALPSTGAAVWGHAVVQLFPLKRVRERERERDALRERERERERRVVPWGRSRSSPPAPEGPPPPGGSRGAASPTVGGKAPSPLPPPQARHGPRCQMRPSASRRGKANKRSPSRGGKRGEETRGPSPSPLAGAASPLGPPWSRCGLSTPLWRMTGSPRPCETDELLSPYRCSSSPWSSPLGPGARPTAGARPGCEHSQCS